MSAVYDYEPQPREDPLVKDIDEFCTASFPALTTEKAVLLKVFPFCEFFGFRVKSSLLHIQTVLSVPEWIPWLSRIRRESKTAYDLSIKVTETPYQMVQKRMVAFLCSVVTRR